MPFKGEKIAVTVNRLDPGHVAVTVKNRTGSRKFFNLPNGEILRADGNAEGTHVIAFEDEGPREFAVTLDDGSRVPHESSDPEVVSDGNR